jgi:type II secretory pathway predicted ATPase ExeA
VYLEHFGLSEAPFRITPVTEFFFSGAERGEILNALLYAVTTSEGIIKISGEVGSGKTTLCRMLLERLPPHVKPVYLANPCLSREELLYAIADGLGLNLDGQRISVMLQNLQNHLLAQQQIGKRCVVLVDEAHAMPMDTLEELRLLYNLQAGKDKLIQIVLVGQPELDAKLSQSSMRQLKDRIVHHFNMQPLSKKILSNYLMFRMQAAGYRGPDVFSPGALQLMSRASNGLMRRVNILADKSLLAAFIENTRRVEVRHVQAAIRDSELWPAKTWISTGNTGIAAVIFMLLLTLGGSGWFISRMDFNQPSAESNTDEFSIQASTSLSQPTSAPEVAQPNSSAALTIDNSVTLPKNSSLLEQRIFATKNLLIQPGMGRMSIQLFLSDGARPARLERFLMRAKNSDQLSSIYILPLKINEKDSFRILYGYYANREEAVAGLSSLPQKYKDAFTPFLFELEN